MGEFFIIMNKMKPLWIPNEEMIADSNLSKYEQFLKKEYGIHFTSYSDLHKWSTSDIESFWKSIWKFSGIIHSIPYEQVIDRRIMPGARWFVGARLKLC